jgi:hypothetical protein
MNASTPNPSVRNSSGLIKGLAALQFLLAIIRYVTADQSWTAVSAMIALSLAMILFSRERINDERVVQLKLRAISYGLFGGLLAAAVFDYRFTRLHLSIFDGLIIVLVVALVLFNYWRWQDGQAEKGD